ncbi:hypothetical protein PGB90_010524 [Kerria lacca]
MTKYNKEFFQNKIILAPMVRMNTLPFRLLALDYGADIVYSEEIIDHKLLKNMLDTIDYIDTSDGSLIFRTCSREKNKIIFQIGTSDAERAAQAASIIENDVAGIDVNMGCPKHFSVSGGMGAALLSNISKASNIIQQIRNKVNVPITCKIRILENDQETINFCKVMKENGVSAIAVHGRTVKERPYHRNRNSVIANIAKTVTVPIIANGGSNTIETYEDIIKFKADTNCSSVMLARSAQNNPSVFRKSGKLPLDEVIKSFLKYAIHFDNCFPNTKYCIQSMLKELQNTPKGKLFLESQNLEEICDLWNLGEIYHQKENEFKSKGLHFQCDILFNHQRKKFKSNLDSVLTLHCSFIRSKFTLDSDLPKNVLLKYSQKYKNAAPKYQTKHTDKLFQSTVTFNNQKYSSTFWEKNKKSAEQGAAIVCLCYLKVYNETELKSKGIII